MPHTVNPPPTPGGPDLAERYAVLLDLARSLGSTLVPAELHAAVYNHVLRVLPMSSFAVGVTHNERDIRPAFHEGAGLDWFHFTDDELDRLRAGDYVLSDERDDRGAMLAAPLLCDARLLGCLAAMRRRGRTFDATDAYFLLAVGRLAGVALDNAGLFSRLQQRGREAELLENIARDLSTSLDPNEIADRIAEHAFALVHAPVIVWLRDGDRMRALARAGGALIRLGEERSLPTSLVDSFTGDPAGGWRELDPSVLDSPARTVAPDDVNAPAPIDASGDRVLVPLALGDRLVGVIALGPRRHISDAKLRLLQRMAAFAASALENGRLHAKVRRLSLTDPLVQLPNRRQLDLFLEKEFEAARRGRQLTFVLYDLDHFKKYNDTQGHRAGDVALIRFAEVLQQETRAMNLAARYGGEEFATVLADTGLEGGRAHAERVRRRAEEVFEGTLTVSAGVARYSPDMDSAIELVVAADSALYRAKTDGRNRVHVAIS